MTGTVELVEDGEDHESRRRRELLGVRQVVASSGRLPISASRLGWGQVYPKGPLKEECHW